VNASDLNAIADNSVNSGRESRSRLPKVLAIVGTGFVGSTTAYALLMAGTPVAAVDGSILTFAPEHEKSALPNIGIGNEVQ